MAVATTVPSASIPSAVQQTSEVISRNRTFNGSLGNTISIAQSSHSCSRLKPTFGQASKLSFTVLSVLLGFAICIITPGPPQPVIFLSHHAIWMQTYWQKHCRDQLIAWSWIKSCSWKKLFTSFASTTILSKHLPVDVFPAVPKRPV